MIGTTGEAFELLGNRSSSDICVAICDVMGFKSEESCTKLPPFSIHGECMYKMTKAAKVALHRTSNDADRKRHVKHWES